MRLQSVMTSGLLLVSISQTSRASDLVRPVREPAIVSLLSSIVSFKDIQTDSGLLVKVYQTSGGGECDPDDEARTCPKSSLIFVSGVTTEGVVSPKIWQTAQLIDWQVSKISDRAGMTQDGASDDTVAVDASACRAPELVESGKVRAKGGKGASASTWWSRITYRFVIHADRIDVKQVGAIGDLCELY
jgi:hypothetical protein